MKTKGLILLTLLLGCFLTVGATNHVKGNGQLTTKKISIGDYNAIKIGAVADFYYEQNNEAPYIEVTIDENLHQYVNLDVTERELQIGFKGATVDHFTKFTIHTNSKWLKEVKIDGNAKFVISTPISGDELKINGNSGCVVNAQQQIKTGQLTVEAAGSCTINIAGISVTNLNCKIAGNGIINITNGTAKTGECNIANKGQIHAFGCMVDDMNCKIIGKGQAEVSASKNLYLSLIGRGSISYKGEAEVHQTIVGGGKVQKVVKE